MRRRLLVPLAAAALFVAGCTRARPPAPAPVALIPIGEFSDMQQDGEHCNGYAVDLWKRDASVEGLLSYCAGMVGDQPVGQLSNSAFDPKTGKLSFTTRLSTGSRYENGQDVPTRDVWRFDGTIKGGRLSGKLTEADLTQPKAPPEVQSISLPRTDMKLETYPSYESWRAMAAEKLKLNGPKW